MTFDLQKIFESKRKFRRELAVLPIEEKLRLLDALRERQLAIDPATELRPSGVLREEAATNRTPLTPPCPISKT